MERTFKKTLVVCLIIILSLCQTVDIANSLATLPATENLPVKLKIMTSLISSQLRLAKTEDEESLLRLNKSNCLRLYSGQYLISEEFLNSEGLEVLKAVYMADIGIYLKILRSKHEDFYKILKKKVLQYFPNIRTNDTPYTHLNRTLSNILGWMQVVNQKLISIEEVPEKEKKVIEFINNELEIDRNDLYEAGLISEKKRKKIIKISKSQGMYFYKIMDPTEKVSDYGFGVLHKAVEKYTRSLQKNDIRLNYAYKEIIFGMFLYLGFDPAKVDLEKDDFEGIFMNLLKNNGIKSILEVGCGDCNFLAMLSDIVKKSGVLVSGIDLDPRPSSDKVKKILDDNGVKVKEGNVLNLNSEQGYDLIISSGVLSFFGSELKEGCSLTVNELVNSVDYSRKLFGKIDGLLSSNDNAASFINSISTLLMLYPDEVNDLSEILLWDNQRKINFFPIYDAIKDNRGKELFLEVWNSGATFLIAAKKGNKHGLENSSIKAYQNSQLIKKTNSYLAYLKILAIDLLYSKDSEKRKYTLKYDQDFFDAVQIGIIKAYAGLLEKKNNSKINLVPFSADQGSEESLIAVYAKGEGFKGEGHVNLDQFTMENKGDYLIRLTGMLNLAFASASIPEDVTRQDFWFLYHSFIGFVKRQYKSLTGSDLELKGTFKGKLNKMKNITIRIPESERWPAELMKEYYELELKILTAG